MTQTILADIGGTHARFALLEAGAPAHAERLSAASHETLLSALMSYNRTVGGAGGGRLMLATAANPHADGIWRFHNDNRWEIDLSDLARQGWHVDVLVNDFAASARGAVALSADNLLPIKQGSVGDLILPRAVMGPGTGLGLAYVLPRDEGRQWHVQPTFGGHMLAATRTKEQHEIITLLRRHHGRDSIVPEDVASGRGLPVLYRAVCQMRGVQPALNTAEDILMHGQERDARDTLRLFHEFLGLFAQNAVVTGHAFGGLYLDGGVYHRLQAAQLFDRNSFVSSFVLSDLAPVVREALDKTPIYGVNDPYIALRGLAAMAGEA